MNLINKVFGRWTIVSEGLPYTFPSTGYTLPRYNCKCSCGKEKLVRLSTLESGESKSCGCLNKEICSNQMKTHGLSKHRLYSIWFDMNRRCFDSSRKDYVHYGGRGIIVDPRWVGNNGLVQFIEDMMPTYKDGLEIERINVNGNYCKENCSWETRRNQVINRRVTGKKFDSHFIEFNGEKLCISQWADRTGLSVSVISGRINKLKWSIEDALTIRFGGSP